MRLLIFTIIAFLGVSCTPQLTPFTTSVQEQVGLSDEQLKQVQFYTSSPIVIYRQVTNSATEVISGEIKMVDGRKIEEVVINSGTPGVLLDRTENGKLVISFESGNNRHLYFGENPKRGGVYSLMAKDWEAGAKVEYDGKLYYLKPTSTRTVLMVSMKNLKNYQVRSRKVSGRTVANR